MANIKYQDPGSTEAKSTLLAGITEGLDKISSVLNLGSELVEDMPMENLKDNRLYQSAEGNKLWLEDVSFKVKVNGVDATQNYTVDYVGGGIFFELPLQPSDEVTVTANHIVGSSKSLSDKANGYKEYNITIPANAWTTEVPYTNAVEVLGLTDSGVPVCSLISTDDKIIAEYNKVTDIETFEGRIVATANKEKPTTNIVIRMVVLY